jgi:hypothetical protein
MNIITYQASDVIDFLLHNELAPVFGVHNCELISNTKYGC